jgi:hypothetical protein
MKLGRDKLKRQFQWFVYNYLKINLWGSKMIKKVKFGAMKKVDGSVFFWSDFDFIAPKSGLYGFIEKQAPQKALCLGPDPPLGNSMKFIENYDFLAFLGLQ